MDPDLRGRHHRHHRLTATLFSGTLRGLRLGDTDVRAEPEASVMERGAKVKMRGVQIGRVAQVTLNQGSRRYRTRDRAGPTALYSGQCGRPHSRRHPVQCQVCGTGLPKRPEPQRLAANSIINSDNVSTEINTLFRDVADILDRVDPAKPRPPSPRWPRVYGAAAPSSGRPSPIRTRCSNRSTPRGHPARRPAGAQADQRRVRRRRADILTALDAATPTAAAIVDNAAGLDHLLTGVIGLARGGIDLIGSSQSRFDPCGRALRIDRTAAGQVPAHVHLYARRRQTALDTGYLDATGGANHKSIVLDSAHAVRADATGTRRTSR